MLSTFNFMHTSSAIFFIDNISKCKQSNFLSFIKRTLVFSYLHFLLHPYFITSIFSYTHSPFFHTSLFYYPPFSYLPFLIFTTFTTSKHVFFLFLPPIFYLRNTYKNTKDCIPYIKNGTS